MLSWEHKQSNHMRTGEEVVTVTAIGRTVPLLLPGVKFWGAPWEIFQRMLQRHLSLGDRQRQVGEVARRRANTGELLRD